jgi:hypothetical protein
LLKPAPLGFDPGATPNRNLRPEGHNTQAFMILSAISFVFAERWHQKPVQPI